MRRKTLTQGSEPVFENTNWSVVEIWVQTDLNTQY